MKLKTKLTVGIGFLFIVILVFGILGIVSINRLSIDADKILKNNYETLVYDNNMLRALDELPENKKAFADFEANLTKQEKNITEFGEEEATKSLRTNFEELKQKPKDSSNYRELRQSIQIINNLNQNAILHKNETAQKTASSAIFWLTIIFSVLTIISFTLTINFPDVISTPVKTLSRGIREIANKNYSNRIHMEQDDEFKELADSINTMAEKLHEYEHSNLAKIKFEKSRIETIINQMKDGIMGFDERKNILFLNAVSEKMLGLKEKEIIGQYAPDIALKNDLMRRLLQNDDHHELKIYADNKESYFNKDIIKVSNDEQVIGEVIVLRNITPFHELNEAKTNFIATVSHELKTPISAIKMSLQLLQSSSTGELNEEQQQLIEGIKDDSNRLLKITGELLNMSQVETGNIQLSIQPCRPYDILQYALDAVKVQADQKQVTIKINAIAGLPNVKADKEKTAWVLINFLTNALRYTPENGEIQIEILKESNKVLFAVKDYGIGIDTKYKDKIFERYFQVPGNGKTGTGLGLSISKEFIEAQGGSIHVDSEIGVGSRFYFTLMV
ncbi:ATP-binding protein [Parasediminibacterium sp. JCM 36343]|uniref:HAMP domain-containing sensor histidine kinase n=1 Tax=Parasediminibacterium sp. JCM 36343 TaxID=3374279 RepID=UPI00397A28D2